MIRKYEYIGIRGKTCEIVESGSDWFDYRKGEEELPVEKAFCRTCGKETCKPVAPNLFSCKAGIFIAM